MAANEPRSPLPWLLVVGMAGLITAALLANRAARKPDTPAQAEPFRILCTFLPPYVMTLNVVGDTPGVAVELLIAPETGCPHGYSARAKDLKRIAAADVIVANGLGVEGFLERLTRGETTPLITLSDGCEVLPARCHGHDHDADHDHGEINPHVWVSPRQAIRQVESLVARLSEIDPERAEQYRENGAAFSARLETLHTEMKAAADRFENRNVVTFHDAFDYLAHDLDLHVVATLAQDPSHAPSAGEMARIIDAIKRADAAAVFYEPAYSDRLARTVARDAGVPVFPLNPFNSIDGEVTARSYEEVMRANLETLQQALVSTP